MGQFFRVSKRCFKNLLIIYHDLTKKNWKNQPINNYNRMKRGLLKFSFIFLLNFSKIFNYNN